METSRKLADRDERSGSPSPEATTVFVGTVPRWPHAATGSAPESARRLRIALSIIEIPIKKPAFRYAIH
jgi:hypothetical protein